MDSDDKRRRLPKTVYWTTIILVLCGSAAWKVLLIRAISRGEIVQQFSIWASILTIAAVLGTITFLLLRQLRSAAVRISIALTAALASAFLALTDFTDAIEQDRLIKKHLQQVDR